MSYKSCVALLGCIVSLSAYAAPAKSFPKITINNVTGSLDRHGCMRSDFVDAHDFEGLDVQSLTFVFVKHYFPYPGGGVRPAYDVRSNVSIDVDKLRSEYESTAKGQIPYGIDVYRLTDFHTGVGDDGAFKGSFHLEYQARAGTKLTRFVGWKRLGGWLPYPEFEQVTAITDVPGADVAGTVHSVGAFTWIDKKSGLVNLVVHSTYSVEHGPSNLLKNIVGVFTLGIGSKLINDRYKHQLNKFRSSIATQDVEMLQLPVIRREDLDIKFISGLPQFVEKEGMLQVAQGSTLQNPLPPAEAREFYDRILQAKKFFQSCRHPITHYQVRTGDSLWKIARHFYGDGQYYHVVASSNKLTTQLAKPLAIGRTLTLPPYYQLVARNEVLIQAGDTLWSIAKMRLGSGARYRDILRENRLVGIRFRDLPTLLLLKVNENTPR